MSDRAIFEVLSNVLLLCIFIKSVFKPTGNNAFKSRLPDLLPKFGSLLERFLSL